jgi:putative sterol carrier protein
MGHKYASLREAIDHLAFHFLPEKAAGIDAVFQLQFTGDGGGSWYLVVRDQSLQVAEGTYGEPSIAITVSAQNWLSVINDETSPMTLFMQGKLKFDGDLGLAMQMRELFSRERRQP